MWVCLNLGPRSPLHKTGWSWSTIGYPAKYKSATESATCSTPSTTELLSKGSASVETTTCHGCKWVYCTLLLLLLCMCVCVFSSFCWSVTDFLRSFSDWRLYHILHLWVWILLGKEWKLHRYVVPGCTGNLCELEQHTNWNVKNGNILIFLLLMKVFFSNAFEMFCNLTCSFYTDVYITVYFSWWLRKTSFRWWS